MVIFVSFAADFLATARGVPPAQTTAMLVLFNAASVVLSLVVGRWSDRTGRPGVLIAGGTALLSCGLGGFYLALVYTTGAALLGGVVASAVLAGFGSAFHHPLSATILQSSFQDASRGRALGYNGAIGSLGRAAYPSLFFLVPVIATIYDPFGVFAAVGLGVAVVLWLGLRAWRAPAVPPAPTALPAHEGQPTLRSAATRGAVLLTATVFIRSMATQGIVSWLPVYITLEKGAGLGAGLGLVITTMYAAAIPGQPMFGWLVDHYDRRLILGLSSVGSGLSILAYLFSEGWLSVVCLLLFGLFTFSGFPLFLSLAADYVPREAASSGNALVWGLGASGGSLFGPLVAGAIIVADYALLGLAFEVLAVVALVSAVGTALLPRPVKGSFAAPIV
jgi:MFS family permease